MSVVHYDRMSRYPAEPIRHHYMAPKLVFLGKIAPIERLLMYLCLRDEGWSHWAANLVASITEIEPSTRENPCRT